MYNCTHSVPCYIQVAALLLDTLTAALISPLVVEGHRFVTALAKPSVNSLVTAAPITILSAMVSLRLIYVKNKSCDL